jgi:hypothetical protein
MTASPSASNRRVRSRMQLHKSPLRTATNSNIYTIIESSERSRAQIYLEQPARTHGSYHHNAPRVQAFLPATATRLVGLHA